ncbi:copper homeostasis protein CutC [Carboxylicivirga sp. A043]|uniref:copper homeostasis protein CutC n=1 Tax=Carboxylicivirga litoralis TaxID=2816963 RepID=UPI0021CB5651|nr:copper homeostasis protein CutC [Carboxylicivirga sp. A043]MCU4157722.1 copper homeostasis protein CutC [Carboxylicivirga sp. A043]
MSKELKFEVCIDSVQSAINAQEAGAHRVELCDNLFEGGTTPSAGMIKQVKKEAPNIGLFVIIRPRGGDFLYSEKEIQVMLADIEIAKQLGADGIVSGCLLENGEIDSLNTKRLIEACGELPFTFHRAFDMCSQPNEAIEQLIELGAARILTSGMQQTALLGRKAIKQFIEQANNRITILVGSGVKPNNIAQIAVETKACEFHFSGRVERQSEMKYKNNSINMGGIAGLTEFSIYLSDVDVIKDTIKAAKEIYM